MLVSVLFYDKHLVYKIIFFTEDKLTCVFFFKTTVTNPKNEG